MRSPENPQRLAALYSWDGTMEQCFSNRHPENMDLDAPGGARSLIVQCFRSEKPLHMVTDCAEDSRTEGGFVYFSSSPREKIKSMVAYRYLLRNSERADAMILTMDTDSPGFFSPSREFECRLVLEEIGNRIELEVIALNVIQKLTPIE